MSGPATMPPAGADDLHVYDSEDRPTWTSTGMNVLERRQLVRLLARREVHQRYRRSYLGVLWTLLTPILTVIVLWAVFQSLFSPTEIGVPYVVYLVSGVVVFTTAAQGIQQVGGSLVAAEPILSRVHVPPEVLAAGSGTALCMTAALFLLPLFGVQVVAGVGIPPTAVLAVVVILLLVLAVVGVGLMVAASAVRLPDVLNVVPPLVLMLGYLTPTFYPVSVVPEPFRSIVEANPLTIYLTLLRSVSYGGELGSARSWVLATGIAFVSITIGGRVYTRMSRQIVVVHQ
jgi:ABC-type polysaccharide/polyol phosphate export permease